jgi:hypothetical protein
MKETIYGRRILATTVAPSVLAMVSAVMLVSNVLLPQTDHGKLMLHHVEPASTVPLNVVNRSSKGDRLPILHTQTEQTPASAIRKIGLEIVRALHQVGADQPALTTVNPAPNTTIVSKSRALQEPGSTPVKNATFRREPLPHFRPPTVQKRPIGCDPLFSPFTTPSLSHLTGRCIS